MDTTLSTRPQTTDELRDEYRTRTGDNPPRAWNRADLVNYLAAARRR